MRCWAQAPGPTGERGLGLRGPAPGAPGAEWRAVLLRDPCNRAACSPPLPGRRLLASPAAWSGARGHGGGGDVLRGRARGWFSNRRSRGRGRLPGKPVAAATAAAGSEVRRGLLGIRGARERHQRCRHPGQPGGW